MQTLPWTNLNQIQVVFSENVNVQQSDLMLTGVNTAQYSPNGFSYNASTNTAIWTLPASIGADRLTLNLDGHSAGGVHDQAGNLLDGDWTNGTSVYPSGNGAAGGDFNFAFNVLPGDANQDGIVNGQDIAQVASHWLQSGVETGDTNGDAVVNGQDIAAIASHWLATLPAAGGGPRKPGRSRCGGWHAHAADIHCSRREPDFTTAGFGRCNISRGGRSQGDQRRHGFAAVIDRLMSQHGDTALPEPADGGGPIAVQASLLDNDLAVVVATSWQRSKNV